MAPDRTPRLIGARPAMLLIAACCAAALAALPQAAADCQAASNFKISFLTGTAARACFNLEVAAECSSDDPCCLKSEAKIKKLLLAPDSGNPACVSRDNLKLLKVTLNAAQTKSRPAKSNGQRVVNTGIKDALSPKEAVVCVDASAVPGCGTIKELCGNTCSFRLTARGPSRGSGKRATCCLDAPVTPPPPPVPYTPGKFNLVTINVGTAKDLDIHFELPDVEPKAYGGSGFEWWPGYNMTVDDVAIFYELKSIDGKGGTLGQAGPRYKRKDYWETPITGKMTFDVDDLYSYSPDQWRSIILHEMGHASGFGAPFYWQEKHKCIPSCTPRTTVDSYYACTNAAREFAALPNCGPNLPIETEGKPGEACGHWERFMFEGELMEPSVLGSDAVKPISSVTIGALEDIYGPNSVDYTQADPWDCSS
ncbi:hypothetical protein Rsub_02746 [Raphidocelis subcapitata]|uniref:Leishmanolysin-like peptidase n=1 Tax=Raphidocelis subcapitata TaxID=307507 RepID=A0A2V0NQU2_9CHLO|nr:hypothetical protein Rsub_02746 [Raphidocelis subcapitata]|eukprot:GBF90038.1 hypothetical protein Rsub_02746 [Raphidocelis subcapitata]